MAAILTGPDARSIQKDPVQSNVMADSSLQGGWGADIIFPVKPVLKDYFRHGVRDHQTLLSDLEETLYSPGGLPNKIGMPVNSWLTALILDRALRAEVPFADIDNSPSPEQPVSDASRKIANGLRAAIERLVVSALDPAGFDTAHKEPASAPWAKTGTAIEEEIGLADVEMVANGGLPSNLIVISPRDWPRVWNSAEVKAAYANGFNRQYMDEHGGIPLNFFGKRLLVPGGRTDEAPTGTFSPGFFWGTGTARLIYTSSPNGEPFSEGSPNFGMQGENQTDGSAFEAFTQDDPLLMKKVKHVWGSVRRSAPTVLNVDHAYLITGI